MVRIDYISLEHVFPYIENNHPNWLIFFRGIQTRTTNRIYIYIDIIHNCKHIHITLVDEVEANKEAMLHGVIGKEATQPASPHTALRGWHGWLSKRRWERQGKWHQACRRWRYRGVGHFHRDHWAMSRMEVISRIRKHHILGSISLNHASLARFYMFTPFLCKCLTVLEPHSRHGRFPSICVSSVNI